MKLPMAPDTNETRKPPPHKTNKRPTQNYRTAPTQNTGKRIKRTLEDIPGHRPRQHDEAQ